MKEITGYIKVLQIDAANLLTIAATLLTVVFILSVWLLFKKLSVRQKRKEHETGFGSFLCKFSSLCEMHYRYAALKLHGYMPRKGNEFDGKSITSDGRQEIATIDPETLFKNHQVLLSGEHAGRITTVLIDTLYQMRSYNHKMDHFLSSFNGIYQEGLKEYYGNIYELGRLCDELRKYAKGKSLNKAAGEWMNGFFSIFDQWVRNGRNSDMMVLQNEIVLKVVDLNRNNTVSPFSNRSNEKVNRCEMAFRKIADLDDSLRKQLSQYIWAYKRAAKIAWLIGKSIIPASQREAVLNHAQPIVVKHAGVRKEIAIGLGFIIIAVIGFLGGTYFSRAPIKASVDKKVRSYHISEETGEAPQKSKTLPAEAANSSNFPPLDSVPVIYGLDIAHYQGNLLGDIDNFDSLHFVICKATQGVSLIDARFDYNWKRLKELNIIRGAYHFYMAIDDPVGQAQHFLRTVDTLTETDIPLVLDIEEQSLHNTISQADLQSGLLVFLDYIKKHTGRKPIIYTDLSFANTYLQQKAFADYPLWLAEYSKKPIPRLPVTWKEAGIVFWQKTDTFSVGSKKTDLDVFNGNGAEFIAFIKQQRPPTDSIR